MMNERDEGSCGSGNERCEVCGCECAETMSCTNCGTCVCASCGTGVDDMVLCPRCLDTLYFSIALAGFIM